MKPINAKRLAELGACEPELDRFREIFGEGDAPLTVETAVKYAEDFSWGWAAEKLLTPSLRCEYEEAEGSLWYAYRKAEDNLRRAHKEAAVLARCARPINRVLLWRACHEAIARLFASLYITGELPPNDSLPEPFRDVITVSREA